MFVVWIFLVVGFGGVGFLSCGIFFGLWVFGGFMFYSDLGRCTSGGLLFGVGVLV